MITKMITERIMSKIIRCPLKKKTGSKVSIGTCRNCPFYKGETNDAVKCSK